MMTARQAAAAIQGVFDAAHAQFLGHGLGFPEPQIEVSADGKTAKDCRTLRIPEHTVQLPNGESCPLVEVRDAAFADRR